MRRLSLLIAIAIAALMASGCAPQMPWAAPPPTPTRYVPSTLLTPRPTPAPATLTPAPVATVASTPRPQATLPPPPTPTPRVVGTPIAVSEPLQGFLVDDRLFSPIIGESFKYRVYLPPDYQRSGTRRYPVLYMLHGNGGNYTEWTDSFLPEQADRMIVAGEIEPLIIVMPDDGEATYWANWSEGGPRWADYVVEDVVSIMDLRYRTRADAGARAVGGMSMGGLGALNLAFQHPNVFGVVGGHSPSVRLKPDPALWFLAGDNFWEHNPVWLAQNRDGLESIKIWLDAGTDDVWLPNIKAVHEALTDRGIEPTWTIFPGPHEAEYWIEHIPDYLRFYSEAMRG